jgi:hypothetical protein
VSALGWGEFVHKVRLIIAKIDISFCRISIAACPFLSEKAPRPLPSFEGAYRQGVSGRSGSESERKITMAYTTKIPLRISSKRD